MKKAIISLSAFLLLMLVSCNNDAFPVSSWNSNNEALPIIFYVSGDAGFNTFSKNFAGNLHQHGYDVFALNTQRYFWNKKTPQQAATDTENYLKNILQSRTNKNIILLGFSYGADVSPFIYNRFDNDFKKNIKNLIIIGPSKVNDFEIHLTDYFSGETLYGYSVVHEINRLKNVDFTMILSDFEYHYFPFTEITLKNYRFVHLHGDHHYGGDTKKLADFINVLLHDSKKKQ